MKKPWMRYPAACLLMMAVSLSFCLPVSAGYAAEPISAKKNITLPKRTTALMKRITATTPKEPESSDVEVVHPATLLATRRIPQGYATDGIYYYFLSCMAFSGKKHSNLRLTRVRYLKDGTYKEDYMTLKGFGHGTNLDCVRYKGKTWLWTGSDPVGVTGPASTISCFQFKKGKTLKKHASIHYKIHLLAGAGYAANTYPAISSDGTRLLVRYSNFGKQNFKLFKLKKGRYIDNKHPLITLHTGNTSGDFQGFDYENDTIYTIEGSASRAERKELHKKYHPIKIKSWNILTGKKQTITVKGAAKLSHREPEGIQVIADDIEFGLASHYKDKYTCMNIYRNKK